MMENNNDELAREEERRRDEERRREAGASLTGGASANTGDQSALRDEAVRREAGAGLAGAAGAANQTGGGQERRNETWIGVLGATFLGAIFLVFFGVPILQGTQSILGNPVAQTTSGATSQGAAIIPVVGNGTGTAQTPVANAQATPTVSTPTPTVAPPPPTTTAAEGPIIALFTGGPVAVTTVRSFSGPVTITVSGTGKAQATFTSDAFYIFTNASGQSVSPSHHTFAGLCINGQRVDKFVQAIPAYSPDHTYRITIIAPGGPLTFGVCDTNLSDNSGSFTIKIS